MTTSWLADKVVLVTGAAGTVGSALVEEILAAEPRVVRAFDCFEHGLFQLQQRLGDSPRTRWLLGDVRDLNRLRRAMEGVDVVFHCAALKHVALGEYNPFEVVQTNLVGLQNVIQAALDCRVDRVIFTSSDKAVSPTNTMGASKLMGERLMASANEMRGSAPTRFASVRFGNILGSNGSVVDIFRRQIIAGGPVTITDRRMTRFVMGRTRAVRLVLRAGEMAHGGEVFVLKMPALRVPDLADVLIANLASRCGRKPSDIRIVEIGSKRGEKRFEELLTEDEMAAAFEDDDLIVYVGERTDGSHPRHMKPVTQQYHSGKLPLMALAEIRDFLEQNGMFALGEEGTR
jgi:FlaA1/EpsC-like NDP-sugar epimerase